MMTLELTLPWPPSNLSPNARHGHWACLARAKKRFRHACAYTARTQGAGRLEPAPEVLAVHLRFVPPDRRHRDHDNCLAAMKSGLDGLADVLGVDDSRWRLTSELPVAGGAIGGFVKVTIADAAQADEAD
jgi:crossover junction endodeoxyribonuclease RusA